MTSIVGSMAVQAENISLKFTSYLQAQSREIEIGNGVGF